MQHLDLVGILGVSIPIIAIVMGIGIGMLAITLDYKKRSRLLELHHKERLAAIERGIEVPPLPLELLEGPRIRSQWAPGASLRTGLVLLFVGLAICVALYYNGDGRAWALWGLVPAAVGLAYLLHYYLHERHAAERERSSSGSADSPTVQ